MLSRIIFDEEIPSQQVAVISMAGAATWTALRQLAHSIYKECKPLEKRRVGLSLHAAAESYAALAALDKLECDVFLLDSRRSEEEIRRLAQQLRLGAVLQARCPASPAKFEVLEYPGEADWSGASSVTVLTSGTTGEPKAARHTWDTLSQPVRFDAGIAMPRWLLIYSPHLYAGLQVMLQCFANRGTLVLADPEISPKALAEFLRIQGVQFISATPSFWKRLLFSVESAVLDKVPLVQITLGGEVVEQWVLSALQEQFPKARIIHIYATTELGKCFSVRDGQEGFPPHYLNRISPESAQMKIVGGELWMRSPNSMKMYDPYSSHRANSEQWFRTGDLVEIKGNRVYFVGRKSDIINSGGSKVHPLEVERVIREVPGVLDVRVFGKSSSIVGQLVACEIVPSGEHDPEQLKESINRICSSRLSSHQQPRLIRIVDRIEFTSAGKTSRTVAI